MKVLGVDPGLNVTGYGLIVSDSGGQQLIEAGVIRSKTSLPLEQRLLNLYKGFEEVVKEFSPDVLSIEELFSHYKHPRTAVIMAHARGLYYLVAAKENIPVFSYSATRIKKSLTGMGRASKDQVARMIFMALNCSEHSVTSDVTDALAAALCHINAVSHGEIE